MMDFTLFMKVGEGMSYEYEASIRSDLEYSADLSGDNDGQKRLAEFDEYVAKAKAFDQAIEEYEKSNSHIESLIAKTENSEHLHDRWFGFMDSNDEAIDKLLSIYGGLKNDS